MLIINKIANLGGKTCKFCRILPLNRCFLGFFSEKPCHHLSLIMGQTVGTPYKHTVSYAVKKYAYPPLALHRVCGL